jgi:phage terminase small subunit
MGLGSGNGRKLNLREQRFIDEYLVDSCGTQAAIRAGYSEKNAKDQAKLLMKRPKVVAAIKVGQLKLSRKTEVTAEKVIERLWEEANFTGKGASHSARVSALAHLAKHFGLLIERVDMTSDGKGLPSNIRVTLVRPGDSGDD